jgi:hypothetical protein
MSASEAMEWIDFDECHVSESWYQTALICLTVVQAFGGNGRARLEDFLPPRARPKTAIAEPSDLKARFAAFRERHNARISQ